MVAIDRLRMSKLCLISVEYLDKIGDVNCGGNKSPTLQYKINNLKNTEKHSYF